ncbi:MAG: hypothetical protein CM15mP103_08480 [Gammaproteobacteria bacterium]|nr:MAG: hypothetical protein CM15mP103_08480 [Gammaproteobacteria bacterium]
MRLELLLTIQIKLPTRAQKGTAPNFKTFPDQIFLHFIFLKRKLALYMKGLCRHRYDRTFKKVKKSNAFICRHDYLNDFPKAIERVNHLYRDLVPSEN